MFLITMLVSAVVLYGANNMSPLQVVLGNQSLSLFWALVLSSGVIALVTTFVFPFISDFSAQMKHMLSPMEMMAVFLVVNFATVWLMSRVSQVFGLGISSWLVVLIVSIVLDVVQGAAMMLVEGMKS